MNLDAQVHLHVIPRYATAREWHGQVFDDRHWGDAFRHEQRAMERTALAALAAEIRRALTSDP
jgi:diadenosine tetraphosphate (Ap4A) HIT family hydrolase